MGLRALLLSLVCLSQVLGPTKSFADNARKRASKHVIAGDRYKGRAEKAKDAGESEEAKRLLLEAADEYQAAYELVPHPLMLYNSAQVYRLAGEWSDALRLYREFLDTDPEGGAAEFAQRYVDILEEKEAKAKEKRDKRRREKERKERERAEKEEEEESEEFDLKLTDKESSSSDPGKGLRYSGIGLSVGGLVAVGIGIKFGLDSRNISDCLSNYPQGCEQSFPQDRWTDEALALEQEGKDAERNMMIFSGIGVAALIGGSVLYYQGHKKGESAKESSSESAGLQISPQVGAEGFGLSVGQRF